MFILYIYHVNNNDLQQNKIEYQPTYGKFAEYVNVQT